MKKRSAVILVVMLLVLGTTLPLSASDKIAATGDFIASVDFTTLSLTPVGANCLLDVEGVLTFSGTLDGMATGTTQALVLAPCEDVAISPPGTYKDVFKFESQFVGMVDGVPVTADLTYQGITEVGGTIDARILLKNGVKGNLDADAVVAVGGDYAGFVRVE